MRAISPHSSSGLCLSHALSIRLQLATEKIERLQANKPLAREKGGALSDPSVRQGSRNYCVTLGQPHTLPFTNTTEENR